MMRLAHHMKLHFLMRFGIPVLQTELKPVKAWLKEANPVMIVDPQHQSLVKWTNKIKNHASAMAELVNDKVITDGLFVSSRSASETLLSYDYEISDAIKETIKTYLNSKETIQQKNIYSQLLQAVETLETVKSGEKNEAGFAALKKIATIFKMIGTSVRAKEKYTPHKNLFLHAMFTIAEIDHCLNKYASFSADSKTSEQELQQQLLDIIARLKALIVNPGKAGLYSDSIAQIATQNKVLKSADETAPMEQRIYLQEFLKLNAIALKQSTKDLWNDFVIDCSKTPVAKKLLSEIIMTACQFHFESELVNDMFVKFKMKAENSGSASPNKQVLAGLYEVTNKIVLDIDTYHIRENERMIASWESRIDEWSEPAKFTRLFEDYEREIIPLTKNISVDDKMQSLTKKVVLKQVQRLTDMMDKSIKSLKGSPEYSGKTDLVVSRFIQMLEPYLELMVKWMRASESSRYNSTQSMISSIKLAFENRLNKIETKQLEPSGFLSVASARMDSSAAFHRQFVEIEKNITLEDLFSLMHQNILACTIAQGKDSHISLDQLPDQLQDLVHRIQTNNKVDLLGITHSHPLICMEYNIPLNNHSAKLTINYNTQTQMLTLQWGFFGMNWSERMNFIARMMSIESILLGCDLAYEPLYNENSRSLECVWKFKSDKLSPLVNNINNIIEHYSDLTESFTKPVSRMLARYVDASDLKLIIKNMPENSLNKIISEFVLSLKKGYETFDILFDYPCLVDAFPPALKNNIGISEIYNNLNILTFDKFEFLIDKFNIKIKTDYTPDPASFNLFDMILRGFSVDDINAFLEKYNPDLSSQNNAILYVLEHKSDNNFLLINNLLKCHAPVTELSLNAILNSYDEIDILSIIDKQVKNYCPFELTIWLYKNLRYASYNKNNLIFLNDYKSKINFDYKDNSDHNSLLELYVSRFIRDESEGNNIAEILSHYRIDLSIHNRLLKYVVSMSDTGYLLDVIIQNGFNFDAIENIDLNSIADSHRNMDSIMLLCQKLSLAKLSELIYSNTLYSDNRYFQEIFKKYMPVLNMNYCSDDNIDGYTLLERLSRHAPKIALDYIKDYQPDMSLHNQIIQAAIRDTQPNIELLKYLITSGINFEKQLIDLLISASRHPDLKSILIPRLQSWGKNKLSKLLCDQLQISGHIYTGQALDIINDLKSCLDFNYRGENRNTLLENIFEKMVNNNDDISHIDNIISNDEIDIAKHKKLLAIIFDNNSSRINCLERIFQNIININDTEDFIINPSTDVIEDTTIYKLFDNFTPEKLTSILKYNLNYYNRDKLFEYLEHYINIIDFNFSKESIDQPLSQLTFFEFLIYLLAELKIMQLVNSDKLDVLNPSCT